jgi:hypothetical protein
MQKFLDRDHPMFRRQWVRVMTVLVPAIMAVVEFAMGGPGWGVLFGAASAWGLWELFLRP